MKSRIIKISLIIITLAMCCVFIYQFINSYAIFYSETSGQVNIEQADWIIYVNNEIVSDGIEKNFVITQNDVSGNVHTRDGYFAPASYFDTYIILDTTNTDVSVKYEVSLDSQYLSDNNNIVLSNISEVEMSKILTRTSENTYTGIITLNELQQNYGRNRIKMTFLWDNYEANNEKDTALATTSTPKFNVPVNIKFSQYLGEVITPYIE